MDSSSGVDKDGESDANSSTGLHDYSDLLIPNPSFSSMSHISSMNIPSPTSDLQKRVDGHHITSSSPHCSSSRSSSIACEVAHQQSEVNTMVFLSSQQTGQPNPSPPNVVVDDSPLQPCIDRNKESLKVKLLMRRPINQLVEQGILPPPKTPAAFAGQRVRLERARMGDLLKAKIQQRPARQELIRQHILEDTDSRVAPSLAEKQRMLKRARLADSLNDHLIHRPGPLELVQKNILHAPDANIEKAIKDGIVSFKATSEGHVPGPSLPCKYTCNEDDSSSDISSPAGTPDTSSSGHTTEASTPVTKQLSDPAIVSSEPCEVTLQPAKTNKSETTQVFLTTTPKLVAPPTSIFPVSPVISQVAAVIPPPPPLPPSGRINPPQAFVLSDGAVRELLPQLKSVGFQLTPHVQTSASVVPATPKLLQSSSSFGKSRSSKKSNKSKTQPKARTIKFHEYKGPLSSQQKGNSSGSASNNNLGVSATSKAESSYELLLKQQQLFLQWQLEWQHKYPQILLPAAPKVTLQGGTKAITSSPISTTTLMSSYPVTTIPASLCTNLINNQVSSQPIAVTTTINASPKSLPVTLAPKANSNLEVTTAVQQFPTVTSIIAPKTGSLELGQGTNISKSENAPSPATSESCRGETFFKSITLNNISEWKVNDLKAELKKRSLTVSGSKMQLVQRLKSAVALSEQTKDTGSKTLLTTKMEVADESSSEAMMDIGNSDDTKASASHGIMAVSSENNNATLNNNVPILDLANGKLNGVPISLGNILDLLGVSINLTNDKHTSHSIINNNPNPADVNNLKNSGVVTTAKVLNQSAMVATEKGEATSGSDALKYIDENRILEQQKQILELQKALRISQQQLQQLAQQKDPNIGGPQKHRLVLQQHIQQKMQQQAIQNQLQNLIQLQTQQAEHKKQHILQQQKVQQQQQQTQLVLISGGTNNRQQILPQSITDTAATLVHPNNDVKTENIPISAPVCLNTDSIANHENSWLQINTSSKSFEDMGESMESKEIPKQGSTSTEKSRVHGIKSQMVDDVLEILIRNGELPASAAQDPHAKPGSASTIDCADSNDIKTNETVVGVPPPPPLPPPTFSVMLPTTIPFSRHHNQNGVELSTSNTFVKTDDTLSKDAQEILRICEDLSNFGKSREAEAATASKRASEAKEPEQHHPNFTVSILDGNSTSMDCGFFSDSKPFDLTDSMDVGFDDTRSMSVHSSASTNAKSQLFANDFHKHQFNIVAVQHNGLEVAMNPAEKLNHPNEPFSFSNSHPSLENATNSSIKSRNGDSGSSHHNFLSDDELLPVSLDMQMDTDYTDWLDTFLPTNTDASCGPGNAARPASTNCESGISQTNSIFHANDQDQDAGKQMTGKNHVIIADHHPHNNNLSTSNANSLFSPLLDDHSHHNITVIPQHHQQQRDPLLSSRSFARIPIPFGGEQQQQFLLQQNNFILAHNHQQPNNHHHNNSNLLLFHNTSNGSATTLMDTDFDELTTSLSKKSETNHATEMPSTTAPSTAIATHSLNDNFLWDFAM